jgi:hypothetical protein
MHIRLIIVIDSLGQRFAFRAYVILVLVRWCTASRLGPAGGPGLCLWYDKHGKIIQTNSGQLTEWTQKREKKTRA